MGATVGIGVTEVGVLVGTSNDEVARTEVLKASTICWGSIMLTDFCL